MKDKNFLDALNDWGSILTDTYEVNSKFEPEYKVKVDNIQHIHITSVVAHRYANTKIVKQLIFKTGLHTIESSAFADSSFVGPLNLPDGLEYIDPYAFNGCTDLIGGLNIPDSVKCINFKSFASCTGFTSLKLPASLINIGPRSFENCTGLTGTIEIPGSVSLIGSSTFANCTNIESLIINDGVCVIKSGAFEGCSGLSGSLTIPRSVDIIEQDVFNGCNFTEINISRRTKPHKNWNRGCDAEIKYY